MKGYSWAEYGFRSTWIVAYDFDGDGVLELVALPYNVVDNYVRLNSPYPRMERALLADIDLDGVNEIVLYSPADGTYAAYKGVELVGVYGLGLGEPVLDVYGVAVAAGNKILYNGTVYTYPGASRVVPVVILGRPYALFRDGSNLYLGDSGGNRWLIYPDAIEPLGAYFWWRPAERLYVLGRLGGGTGW